LVIKDNDHEGYENHPPTDAEHASQHARHSPTGNQNQNIN